MVTQGELARLHELLRECLVQVDGREGQRVTVGFMVAPGYLLTTAHAAGRAPGATVTGSWHGRAWSGQARFASPAAAGGRRAPDIAVVQLADALDHPCARLAHRDPARGTQLSAAWPRERPDGATGQFPVLYAHGAGAGPGRRGGWACHGQGGLLRLVGDRLDLGACGAPVLNLSTGEVCGWSAWPGRTRTATRCRSATCGEALPPGLTRDIFRAHDEYHGRTDVACGAGAAVAGAERPRPGLPGNAGTRAAGAARAPGPRPTGRGGAAAAGGAGAVRRPRRPPGAAASPGRRAGATAPAGELGTSGTWSTCSATTRTGGASAPADLLAELLALDQRAARPSLAAGLRRWAWRIAGAQAPPAAWAGGAGSRPSRCPAPRHPACPEPTM